ncbi:MAG: S41 family peptidase [Enterobacterales bacterium]|nr:S41 family peptidase [Enterobacterales bacterium]
MVTHLPIKYFRCNHLTHWLPSVLLILVFTACGNSNTPPNIGEGVAIQPQSCDIDSQKQFIVDVMHDTYLWYEQVPAINISDYATLNETLDALRAPQDRFSYITTQVANSNFFNNGSYLGFGFLALPNTAEDAFIIGYIFDDSAAGRAGWQRTDIISAIDGVAVSDIIAAGGINTALGGLNDGDSATFDIAQLNGSMISQTLTKGIVNMNSVLVSQVVQTANQKIGYVAISNFLEQTAAEFHASVNQFAQANIDELVIDLRYNGGGRVYASRDVASYIGGSNTNGYNYSKTIHNNKYYLSNSSIPYTTFPDALNFSRVYVLTTDKTCSASELVINSLSPFVEVIQIGGTTCGKPVGMYGKNFCDKIILPIEFQSLNHFDQGDYFNGLTPSCLSNDDLTHAFADPAEGLFSVAINHMNGGVCAVAKQTTRRSKSVAKRVSVNPQENVY